jgi:carbamoyl-phosphate synthase large subunit
MSKKVMILGAGIGQLRIIEICKEAGYETVIVSREREQPGFKYADHFYLHDVTDHEAMLKIAQAERVDAILSDQLDAAVWPVAYVAEKLGLPGIGSDTAFKFTNKLKMRKEAQRLGINVPQFCGVSSRQEALAAAQTIGYPVIIKPADNSASRGVYPVNNEAELEKYFDASMAYSPTHQLMVEQYIIEKEEYCLQSFCHDYKNTNLVIARRDMFDIPNTFIPSATVFFDADSAQAEIEREILALHNRVVTGFGLKFGMAQGEYYYDKKSNKVYLGEIAARGGAVFISSDIIPLACGVDSSKLLVEYALGMPCLSEPIRLRSGAAGYFCFMLPRGTVIGIKNADKIENITGVYLSFLENVSIGMEIGEARDKTSRKGPVVVYGRCKEDCYAVMDEVKQILQIEVRTPAGEIKGIQW